MKSRILKLLLPVLSLFFSMQSSGQATCIAVIDGTRNEICAGTGPVTFVNAIASGENIEWISLGDGIFDNPFSVNPVYTPGNNDRTNGYAYILLDVYKDDTVDFCSQLPWVRLNIGSMAATATPSSQNICTGAAISNIVLSSGLTGATYRWTRDNTNSVTGIASSGTGNISGTLTNNSGSPVTVTFTFTASNGTCTGTPVTATVTVSPRPNVVASVTSQSVCSGSNITPIALSGNFPGTAFNWTRNSTSSVNGISSSGSGNITGIMTKRNGSTTTVTFTITPTLNGCSGSSVNSTVAVSSSSVGVFGTPASQTICTGSAIATIVPSGGGGSTTYTWTRNNTATVTGIAANGSGSINGTLNNTTASPSYVTFTITRSGSSCTNRASVLVNPRPVAAVSPSAQSICSGAALAPVTISSNVAGTVFNWTRNSTATVTGMAASGSGNITGSLVNTGTSPVTVTFTITPVINGCNGSPVTASVQVTPAFAASVSPLSQVLCTGSAMTPVTGNSSGVTFNWTRDNGVSVTGIPASGTGNISGTLTNTGNAPALVTFSIIPSINGCTGLPITATALVNPRPTAVITGSQAVCAGAAAPTLTVALTGTAPWNFTYTNGTTAVNVNSNNSTHLLTVPATINTYTLVNVGDASCTSQPSGVSGTAVISQAVYAITASAGANGSISPPGVTNVNCGASQSYTITANAGYTIQSVIVNGVAVGAVSSYTFNNVTAPQSISATFVTLSSCALTASATAPAMTCNATATNLTVTTAGAIGAIEFSLNGGTYQTSNVFAVTAAGSPYVVTVRDASTGCLTNTNTVTVSPAPTVPATPTGVSGPAYGLCSGGNFTYTVQPVAGATSYVWSAPAGFSIVSGQSTTQVVMAVPAGFTGSPGLWVVSKNACGSTTGFRLALNSVQLIPVADIAGPSTVTALQAGVQYSAPNEAGSTYNWQVPLGATITSGQGSSSITVTFGSSSGNVSVAVTNACGTGPRTSKPVSIALARPVSAKTVEVTVNNTLKNTFSISPNPANSNAAIIFNYPLPGVKYSISISNATGITVYSSVNVTVAGQNRLLLDLSSWRNGLYLVRLLTDKDMQTVRLIKGR